MARPRLLLLLSALAGCASVGARSGHAGWDASTLPSPGTYPASCGRPHVEHSWLCDPDQLLSREGGDAIEAALAAIHRAAPGHATAAAAAAAAGASPADAKDAPVYPRAACDTADGKAARGAHLPR